MRAWALASAGVFCLSAIGYRVLTAPDLTPAVTHLDAASAQWAAASAQQAKSVTAIERDVRAELWHVDRTLTTADGTMQAATGAVNHVGPLLDALKGTSEQATNTLHTTQVSVMGFQAPVAQLGLDLAALEPLITHTDNLVNSPLIPETLANTDDTMKHIDVVTGDLQFEANKLIHPEKKKLGFWGTIWAGVQVAHKFEPPLF
jgi:hypothetical protein